MVVGNDVVRQWRRDQHELCNPDMAAGGQHGDRPGIDIEEEHPGCVHGSLGIYLLANNGNQYQVSGTSVSAPLWAGFAALVNQQAATNNQPPIGFINPAVYTMGTGTDIRHRVSRHRRGATAIVAAQTCFLR